MEVKLIGESIKTIRFATAKELNEQCWGVNNINKVVVIELSNGVKLFPSSDYEGNSGGAIFGYIGKEQFTVYPQ